MDNQYNLTWRSVLRPVSSSTRPEFITDSRVETNGSIRITRPDPIRTQSVYFSMLAEMSGRPRLGVLRRFVFGGPGYLNKMTPELIHRFLEEQNPDLGHDFTLDSMTSKVRFNPAVGDKDKSSDH